jgi:hypothetical protein
MLACFTRNQATAFRVHLNSVEGLARAPCEFSANVTSPLILAQKVPDYLGDTPVSKHGVVNTPS